MPICLNKKNVHTRWQDQKHALYTAITNILLDRIYDKHILNAQKVDVIASRRETKPLLNDEFKSFLIKQLGNNHHNVTIDVKIETPTKEKCLQLADFASWVIFRDREHKDDTFKKIVQNLIIEEISLL